VSVASLSRITIHRLALSADEGSQIAKFLIDTPAIRITPISFACFIRARSNRHSSAGFARTL
jgi:hypothetical protein